jgi:lysozyme family protein/peptidoglycan hydrolase-like protein with peptidoglycan-binding domain
MPFTFESLKDGYDRNWADLQIRPEADASVKAVATRLLKGKSTYQQIEAETGVPWYFIGLCHYRESDFDFDTYLGNGQSLSKRTTEVPADRGPFFGANAFADGAVDALTIQHLVGATDWSIARILYRLEGYNGFGYHNFGVNSPYLYGGSTLYGPPQAKAGKYIRDGVFSASVVDTQLGTAVILKALIGLDQSINFAAPPPAATIQPDDEHASDVLAVQRALNALGVVPRLAEDGTMGPRTMAAVAQFQRQNALTPAGGLLNATTIAAITKMAAPALQPTPSPPPAPPGGTQMTPDQVVRVILSIISALAAQQGSQPTPTSPEIANIGQILTALIGTQKQAGGAQQAALSPDAVQSLLAALAKQLQQNVPSEPAKPTNGSGQKSVPPMQTMGSSGQSVMSKPSVQIGAAAFGLTALLQAIGAIAPPFTNAPAGAGAAAATAASTFSSSPTVGTLATVIPLIIAGIGMTGGWGSLLGIASSLIGAIGNAAKKSQ